MIELGKYLFDGWTLYGRYEYGIQSTDGDHGEFAWTETDLLSVEKGDQSFVLIDKPKNVDLTEFRDLFNGCLTDAIGYLDSQAETHATELTGVGE